MVIHLVSPALKEVKFIVDFGGEVKTTQALSALPTVQDVGRAIWDNLDGRLATIGIGSIVNLETYLAEQAVVHERVGYYEIVAPKLRYDYGPGLHPGIPVPTALRRSRMLQGVYD